MASARRRAAGEGSIYQGKDGRWYASIELPQAGGKRRRRRFVGRTRDAVRQRLIDAQREATATPPIRVPSDAARIRQYAGREVVYFVRNFEASTVKIGYTKNIAERMSSLRTASCAPLALVLCFPGDKLLEETLHRRFHAARIRGEWFHLTSDLESFIRKPVAAPTRLMIASTQEHRTAACVIARAIEERL